MGKKNLGYCSVRVKETKIFRLVRHYGKYVFCVAAGALFYLTAEILENGTDPVENGVLKRNPCGQGDMLYEFSVDGLNDTFSVELYVPEQELSEEQFHELVPEMSEVLLQRILGENSSLQEVRADLELVREIPEYGVDVSWRSERPEIVGVDGSVYMDESSDGKVNEENTVLLYLEAELSNGMVSEVLEIPVVVLSPQSSVEERFHTMLEELVLQKREQPEIVLPEEFEGHVIRYQRLKETSNGILVLLGLVAAICMFLKEKEDIAAARKKKDDQLMEDYPDFVYKFLILIGGGYSAKEAWRKLCEGYLTDSGKSDRPLCEEMQITMNQMETGVPEIRAYAEFGRRCGSRSYVKFASLLESSISTGGKNLRKLLETEVEDAFKLRTDLARRKGEEASSKLLLPTFVMLGVVMVMVMAPAFLTIM